MWKSVKRKPTAVNDKKKGEFFVWISPSKRGDKKEDKKEEKEEMWKRLKKEII